jgi:hypothetical protein
MSDNPIRIPPRPPPAAPARTTEKQKPGAKGAQAKKEREDPHAAPTLGGDSFGRAVTGSSNVQGKFQPGPAASILFSTAPEPAIVGELRQNGLLMVRYDPTRAKLTDQAFGVPNWGVTVTLKFLPGGETHERPAVDFESRPGRHITSRPATLTVKIPLTSTSVRVTFRNWRRGVADFVDDNNGHGFVFGIQPPQKQPQREG